MHWVTAKEILFMQKEKKKKGTMRTVKHWDRKPEKYYAVFILGDFQSFTRQGPEQPHQTAKVELL